MKHKRNRILFFLTIYILIRLGPAICLSAEVYIAEIGVPPPKIYEALLKNYQEKKYAEVKLAVSYLKPVTDTIKSKFGVDFEAELKSGIKAKDESFHLALRKMIFYDLRLIFQAIDEKKETQLQGDSKALFKIAYEDYLLLSKHFLKEDKYFETDMKIKKLFRRTYLSLGSESFYSEKTPPDWKLYKELSNELIKEIAKCFPDWQNGGINNN